MIKDNNLQGKFHSDGIPNLVRGGAAVQTDMLMGEGLSQVQNLLTPLSRGLQAAGGMMTQLLECNTNIPTKDGLTSTAVAVNQPGVLIQDREGEGTIFEGQNQADIEDDGDAGPWAAEVPARSRRARRRQRQAAVQASLPAEASDGEGNHAASLVQKFTGDGEGQQKEQTSLVLEVPHAAQWQTGSGIEEVCEAVGASSPRSPSGPSVSA
jgi:hypothetical protein